jgi:hypothetical protein
MPGLKSVCLCVAVALTATHALGQSDGRQACRTFRQGKLIELRSPHFVFRLDTSSGLRARSWENQLTGRTLRLGDGPEVEIDLGLPDRPRQTPPLEVSAVRIVREGETGEVAFQLTAREPALLILVIYRWDASQPVLRKFVEVVNQGPRELDRLLNVRLGAYRTDAQLKEREQGFPLDLDGQFFIGLAHPAGWATGAAGQVSLRQYPGVKMAPGGRFQCMETVYGVARPGEASTAFVAHLHTRMRRVLRHHDRPYAVFESFGGKPDTPGEEPFHTSEAYLLDNLAKLAEGQRATGCRFDYYSVEFWADYRGDLKRFDRQRFACGFGNVRAEIARLGIAPALWIDSSWELWSIGGNPAVQACLNFDPRWPPPSTTGKVEDRRYFCRATEPIKSLYTEAFRHHIRQNGVRLLKFDGFRSVCTNPHHEHLPGVYSTEPIDAAMIDFLRAMDRECPDVFIMLYWGFHSPWWLLYGDTLFDTGTGINEAASPSDQPAPYARQSVIQELDQAQWVANQCVPPLGKDSLGVWLSSWSWNSQIGKDHWQAAFVMDLCRGSLLAQPWTDTAWLTSPERQQMADFITLLKARPACFGNPRFILGNPWKDEPYGYCCTDGKRAFLALHNGCWRDNTLILELNSAWGLPDGRTWDLYRWWPDPAKLHGDRPAFGAKVSIAQRPFDVVLLEAVAHGESPSLDRRFETRPIPLGFAEASRPIDVRVVETKAERQPPRPRSLTIRGQVPACPSGGTLVVAVHMTKAGAPFRPWSPGHRFLSAAATLAGQTIACRPVLGDNTYPACWQAWRIAVAAAADSRPFELEIGTSLSPTFTLKCSGHFIPK